MLFHNTFESWWKNQAADDLIQLKDAQVCRQRKIQHNNYNIYPWKMVIQSSVKEYCNTNVHMKLEIKSCSNPYTKKSTGIGLCRRRSVVLGWNEPTSSFLFAIYVCRGEIQTNEKYLKACQVKIYFNQTILRKIWIYK